MRATNNDICTIKYDNRTIKYDNCKIKYDKFTMSEKPEIKHHKIYSKDRPFGFVSGSFLAA